MPDQDLGSNQTQTYHREVLELSAVSIDDFVAAETEEQSAFGEEFEQEQEPADLSLSDRIGDTPRRIEWRDGAANDGAETLESKDDEEQPLGSQIFDYLSTHPSTEERLKRIRAAAL